MKIISIYDDTINGVNNGRVWTYRTEIKEPELVALTEEGALEAAQNYPMSVMSVKRLVEFLMKLQFILIPYYGYGKC